MGDGEERGRDAAPADRNRGPAGRLFLGTLFLLAGCTRLILAVLLVYGSPLELYWSSNGTPSKFTPQNSGGLLLGQSVLLRFLYQCNALCVDDSTAAVLGSTRGGAAYFTARD